jgi:hypothetical protein
LAELQSLYGGPLSFPFMTHLTQFFTLALQGGHNQLQCTNDTGLKEVKRACVPSERAPQQLLAELNDIVMDAGTSRIKLPNLLVSYQGRVNFAPQRREIAGGQNCGRGYFCLGTA